jgi:hypothetical protein
VDRLSPNDRRLLQAASVIGRRFDPQLLAVVVGENDVNSRLAVMQTLDLVRPEGRSSDYEFKHALVRDALYQSLLTEPRTALHSKIAEEVERRSGNRLTEVAEVLAHHFSQTDLADKAFAYLSMAGSKNLSMYSLDEGSIHFAAALSLLEKYPDCASDHHVGPAGPPGPEGPPGPAGTAGLHAITVTACDTKCELLCAAGEKLVSVTCPGGTIWIGRDADSEMAHVQKFTGTGVGAL